MTECKRCPALEAEVRRLQAEVRRLQRENARLKALLRLAAETIRNQRRQLNAIMATAHQYLRQAQQALNRGNLPRGTWSLHRGRAEVGQAIYQMAGADLASGILAAIAAAVG